MVITKLSSGHKKQLVKQSVGCRLAVSVVEQIDSRALAMGTNRAGWLAGVILEALGQEPARSWGHANNPNVAKHRHQNDYIDGQLATCWLRDR